MRYVLDHDFHVHTQLSPCSSNPEQNPTRILQYAKENNLKTVITTDHYWDERVPCSTKPYGINNETIHKWGPYPQEDGIRMLIGAEADIDFNGILGINRRTCEDFDFILISATHMHMDGFTCRGDETVEERIAMYIRRLEIILNADIPHKKIGFSHPVTPLICYHEQVLDGIPESEFRRLFGRAAELGLGVEINLSSMRDSDDFDDYTQVTPQTHPAMFRPYRIAKEMGCKFFFGSDSHSPSDFLFLKPMAEVLIDQLELKESDKFILS
ncbi:MAG: hypothetical protein IJC98_02430 [Clostridia bacterium]|nr:hypothetical protein [Clostridia bacterium]